MNENNTCIELPSLDLLRNTKIQAIKELRRVTGWGLIETKNAVEAIASSCSNGAYELQNSLESERKYSLMLKAQVDILKEIILSR